jgi:predicted  nucleic acid-binding Zn-ribbon protein
MPCCDTGRNIQKYKGAAASTLQDVTDNGNTTTGDIITTSGYFIGDGSKLTGISGASAAFTLQETSDRGNTTSNTIQFTNPITSLTTSGNVIVAGNVTASTFYGDGTTLTGVALSVDLTNNVTRISNLESNLTNNSTRISILESNLADNVTRIGNLESNLTNNSTRISILESNLADNVTRIGNLESNLTNNSTRISILESNLTNNSTRISILESNLADNVTRISILESNLADNVTRISILESNLADNVTRIGNLESNLTNNSTRISILESNLADNVTRIGNLESNLVSNASRISTLENEIQPVTRGGTGFTSYGIGDILYASTSSTLSKLTPSTAGHFLQTNGTGNAPTWENVADIGSSTPANLYTDDYITGGPWSGLTDANIRVLGNVSNLSNQLVARDDKGDIFVSNVNAIKYYGDGGTLSNISGSQGLQDVINQDPYTNSPPYFGAGSYGAIYGSNTINASTISTTIGVYGPIKGSNTVTASTISTTTGFYGPMKGSNTITTSGVYGPIYGSNTINASTISTTTGFYGPIKGSNTITTSGVYGPIYGSNTINASTISTTTGFYGPIKGSNTITVSSIVSDNAVGLNRLNASNINSGTLSNVYGGTGFTSYNQGDLLVGTNTNNLKKLPKGNANDVLTVNSLGNDIEWVPASGGGSSLWTQLVNNDIYYNSGNVSISNSTTNHTVHLGSNVIVNDTGNYDVFRVNGNVFTTGYFVGDGSYITGIKQIKNETDTDIIVAGDGAPTRRSLLSRFYN